LATLIPRIATSFTTLARIAKSNVPILLAGETGSGKELLARAIHVASGRSGELVAINCGALPHTLLEAQLFGHVKGAFSGATRDELGYVRAAQRGTLFLDEIGELPPASQVALLRVLQEQEVVPVGTTRPLSVDIRVIAATNAPIDQLVESGSFRSDLFARLSGFRFAAPPLRERIEDLGLLIANLLCELGPREAPNWKFDPAAAQALFRYAWPRNVRELKQCLASATVLASAQRIELSHLPPEISEPRSVKPDTSGREPGRSHEVRTDEALHSELIALFTECRGNVSEVARRMGKARTQVQRWMARFAIEPATFRTAQSSDDDATHEEPTDPS
jgi:transcriptional regulator with PAS, ATPase and Fis domain